MIELLSTVAIILALAGLLLPALGKTHEKSLQAKCLNQLRSAFSAAQLYASDNNDEIVPGSVTTPASEDAELWSVPLVEYYQERNNAKSATFACPKWRSDATSKTAYNWGYAMNVTPGYEGTGSTSDQKSASVITIKEDGSRTGKIFRFSTITHAGQRLFFCDSRQWHVRGPQVTPGNPGSTLASYDRHGKNRCNVMFFDGHIETLYPSGVDSAIFDPANFVNSATP